MKVCHNLLLNDNEIMLMLGGVGGFCRLPDFAWSDWAVGQVERVWDLMDITVLRSAKLGVDPSYKTSVPLPFFQFPSLLFSAGKYGTSLKT